MNKSKPLFSCSRCGYCCQGETTVSLSDKDQTRMLETLKISRNEAFKKYWRKSDNQVQMKTVNGHCIFYNKGCSVHSGRPWRCRQWPLVDAILTDETNFNIIRSSCPGFIESSSYEDVCRLIRSIVLSPDNYTKKQ